MNVPAWVWALTIVAICVMLVVDYVGHVRTPHAPGVREAARWSIVYVAIALLFGVLVWFAWGSDYGGEYLAGYVTEKSLSVDNLFVFVLIMGAFRVPRLYQQKVLLAGITFALVLRAVFIALGAVLIENFAWVFYLFGAFLLYTAWSQFRSGGKEQEVYHENRLVTVLRRILPMTSAFDEDRLHTRTVDGRWVLTPLAVVFLAIGSADVLFAVDSIPAIFGLTQETYLVFAANAFSLLGLRQLYFLIDGLLDRLVFLSYGLGAILAFIGAKLVLHALHVNELPFINSGEQVNVPEVPTAMSLGVIAGVLVITTVASLWYERRRARQGAAE